VVESCPGFGFIGFCDFGYPMTGGNGGCYPILDALECDQDYGKIAEKCGSRTDLAYCSWGPPDAFGGGCFDVPNTTAGRAGCTSDFGSLVDECPSNTLGGVTFYCYDSDGFGDCDRLGGQFAGNARWCAQAGGAIVKIDFCNGIGAIVNN
jgi:hypothetical protein